MRIKAKLTFTFQAEIIVSGICSAQVSQNMVLWYRQPDTEWMQVMPLGNGMIWAMVFGGVQQKRSVLNESSFWSGHPHDYDDPNAGEYFLL